MGNPEHHCGYGKLVLSGDAIVVCGRAIDGPPNSVTVVLSNISCPKVARRLNNGEYTPDEPFAWAAREFVRRKVIGKEVFYTVDNGEVSDRIFGCVFIKQNDEFVSLSHLLVSEGLARVRRNVNPAMLEKGKMKTLITLEEAARAGAKGVWSESQEGSPRKICWTIPDPAAFFHKYGKRPLRGIIEYVRDGNSMQVMLLPIPGDPEGAYYNIMLFISGIKAPGSKVYENERVQEAFSLDAQFYVESRLLQREVTVILESVTNNNFAGSVLHPNGNIAVYLLQEGLAKCLEWNLAVVSKEAGGAEAYRNAEKLAKQRRLRLWKDFVPKTNEKAQADKEAKDANNGAILDEPKEYSGVVIEVGNGDNILVRCQDGVIRKFFFSSLRPPRYVAEEKERRPQQQAPIKPLYQIPWMYDAREFLRKRLIGKSVKVLVDYILPKLEGSSYDDRVCATIMDGTNVGEALVLRGLATVMRYRNPLDSRARDYDALLKAEGIAEKRQVGLFEKKKEPRVHKIIEIGLNVKSQSYLHTLQRREKVDALVEFVISASRFRVEIIAESLLCAISAFGIDVPRASRKLPNQPEEPGEPFGDEAREFARDLVMQRDVTFELTSVSNQGTFIGLIGLPSAIKISSSGGRRVKKGTKFVSSNDWSEILVARGYATVSRNSTTQRSSHYHRLMIAEQFALENNLGLWSSEQFRTQWNQNMNAERNEEQETKKSDGLIFVRDLDNALPDAEACKKSASDRLKTGFMARTIWKDAEYMSEPPTGKNGGVRFVVYKNDVITKLNSLLAPINAPGFPSAQAVSDFQPRKGLVCAVRSSIQNCWCRARILRVSDKIITVFLIDYGCEESIGVGASGPAQFAALPKNLAGLEALATEYRLAYVQLPIDSSDRKETMYHLQARTQNIDIRVFPVQGAPVPCGVDDRRPVPSAVVHLCQSQVPGSSQSSGETIDVAESLLEDGLVFMENVRMPPDLCVRYSKVQDAAMKARKGIWCYGDFRDDDME
ncbi:hypothetical protein Aperf_G00000129155 [Anoplocephala perfoliata]